MSESKTDGVKDSLNAIALSDDGTHVFFYDRSNRTIILLDVIGGERKVIKFLDKDLQRPRWLCYCLFYWQNANSSSDPTERISILWYNQAKKKFCLTTHRLSLNGELTLIGEKLYLPIDIAFDKLGYSAQRRTCRIEIIFYELKSHEKQKFWFFEYDIKTLKLVRDRNGCLPTSSHWELPFITDQALHFVVVKKTQSLLATLQLNEDNTEWAVSDILPDPNSPVHFSRRALWCNCYEGHQFGIFLVSRCVEGKTKAEIWALDTRMASWKHIKTAIDFDGDLKNFAIRLFDNNHLFIHYDSIDDASFLRLENLIREIKTVFATEAFDENVGIGLADVICPICLDNYDNPKTLNCGHSLCHNHLSDLTAKEAMEVLNKIRQSQTFDQRCGVCRLACMDEELWHCVDCPDKTQNICANCTLKHHATHQLQSYNEYKESLNEVKKIQKELEGQSLDLYKNFQEELAVKFKSAVYEKVFDLHKDCLNNYIRANGGRLKPLEMQKRKAMCLKHFNYVFEEILQSTDQFVQSLEDSLFVENACSTLESLQKSTEI